MWNRAESMRKPQSILYKSFIVGSNSCVEYLLDPSKDDSILYVDSRDISAQQFQELHTLIISSMAIVYESLNPEFADEIRKGYRNLIGVEIETDDLYIRENEKKEKYIERVANEVWKEVVDITESNKGETTLGGSYPFVIIYLRAVSDSFREANDEMGTGLE